MKKWLICVTLIVAMLGTMVLPCAAVFADAEVAEQAAATTAEPVEEQPLFEEEAPAAHSSLPTESKSDTEPKTTETSGTCGENLTWMLRNGTLTISGAGAMTNWSSYSNVPWYSERKSITSAVIDSGVTSIGGWAFYACDGLTSVVIPSGVTSIGDSAFSSCDGLTSVTLPSTLTSIRSNAFYGCTGLTTITIPEGMTSVGERAFYRCTGLKSITLPFTLLKIADDAFCDCTELASISVDANNPAFYSSGDCLIEKSSKKLILGCKYSVIPSGVTSIGSYAFDGCTGLKSITLPSTLESIGDHAFYGCKGLASIVIPEGVTSIGEYAFCDCTGLASIVIPEGVTSIGSHAFSGCEGLASVTLPSTLTNIAPYTFYYCDSITSITIPEGVTSIGNYAFRSCAKLTCLMIPASVKSIAESAFDYTYLLSEVFYFGTDKQRTELLSVNNWLTLADWHYAVPNQTCGENLYWELKNSTLTIFGTGAMEDYATGSAPWSAHCKEIARVVLAGVDYVGINAFNGFSELILVQFLGFAEQLAAPTIGAGNDSLNDVFWHSGVGGICGENLFWALENGTLSILGSGAMTNWASSYSNTPLAPWADYITSIKSVFVASGVTSIGNAAFHGCGRLTSITIPEGVTSIGNSAFDGCKGLTSIVIPEGVTSIGVAAFYECGGLASVFLPSTLTSIGTYAFYRCGGLGDVFYYGNTSQKASISVGDSNSYLVDAAWHYADSAKACGDKLYWELKNGTLTLFGTGAMTDWENASAAPWHSDCGSITSIVIYSNVTSIGNYAFDGCARLASITIPSGVTSIGNGAFCDCTELADIYYLGTDAQRTDITIESNNSALNNAVWHYVDPDNTCGENLYWELKNGTLTISGTGAMADWTSASNVPWYSERESITSVVVNSGVTSIGGYAFYYTGLTSVTLPSTLARIGIYAFCGCTGLTDVHISDIAAWCSFNSFDVYSDPMIYANRLYLNDILVTDLIIPEGVTWIRSGAFKKCADIETVSIPLSVTSIGSEAFSGCSGITDVYYFGTAEQKGAISIGSSNSALTNATATWHYVDPAKTCGESLHWDLQNGSLTIFGTGAMTDWASAANVPWYNDRSSITSVTIASGVTGIGAYAFDGCTWLVFIAIPKNVTSIGERAFTNCDQLLSVSVDTNNTAYYSSGNCIIERSSKELIAGCKNSVIPAEVTSIGAYAFCGCSGLTSVTIPASLTSIGAYAFSNCVKLEAVKVAAAQSEGVVRLGADAQGLTIGGHAFDGCETLASFEVPDGVTSIGEAAFRNCYELTAITIPDTVTVIGSGAFSGCTALTDVYFGGTPEQFALLDLTGTGLENVVWHSLYLSKLTPSANVLVVEKGASKTVTFTTDPANADVNLELVGGTKSGNAYTYQGLTVSFDGKTMTVTGTQHTGQPVLLTVKDSASGLTANVSVTVVTLKFTEQAVSLSEGTTTLNFYTDDVSSLDTSKYTATVLRSDREQAEAIKLQVVERSGKQVFKLSFAAGAPEYSVSVTVRVYDMDGKIVAQATSGVRDYAKKLYNYYDTYSYLPSAEDYKALTVALCEFGAEAQKYFKINTDDPADDWVPAEEDKVDLARALEALGGIPAEAADEWAVAATSITVSLQDSLVINYYVSGITQETAADYYAKVKVGETGQEVTVDVAYSAAAGKCVISYGVASVDYDQKVYVTVYKKAGDEQVSKTFSSSINAYLTYQKAVVEQSDPQFYTLLCKLEVYCRCAKTIFKAA